MRNQIIIVTPPARWRQALRSGLRSADGVRRRAQSLEKITYLFPAPPVLPAFGPIRLAQGKGYFKEAGFEVEFAVGRGGVDVAKQVGAGNAPLGGIVADGPIMVRGNGVPVKIVACSAARASCSSWCARTPASRSRPTSRARPSP